MRSLRCSPGTASGLLTGLSPTTLGSWTLGGAENTDGSLSCSGSSLFGTSDINTGGKQESEEVAVK